MNHKLVIFLISEPHEIRHNLLPVPRRRPGRAHGMKMNRTTQQHKKAEVGGGSPTQLPLQI